MNHTIDRRGFLAAALATALPESQGPLPRFQSGGVIGFSYFPEPLSQDQIAVLAMHEMPHNWCIEHAQ